MDNTITIEQGDAAIDLTPEGSRSMTPARWLLNALLQSNIILAEEWQALEAPRVTELGASADADLLIAGLVEVSLLTEFQAGRIRAGGINHLIFGSYRIIDRLGSGGMGVVYKGEHILMRRPVAIKVLQVPLDQGEVLLKRFGTEMRVLARVRHPNIVVALDAGTQMPAEHETQALHYLVMEYVEGIDLERLVEKTPLSVSRACELIYQTAGALDETHRHGLIHRDIKPSNILETPEGTAKLLDFGLALYAGRHRLTNPGTCLGTLGYMAPEQATDSANVDIRADLFALGATLFFVLTGKPPFNPSGHVTMQIAARFTQPPPDVRTHRPDVPAELQNVLRRMMAPQRDDRFPTPQSVMRALLPFVSPVNHGGLESTKSDPFLQLPAPARGAMLAPAAPRVLIVDDEAAVRAVCKSFFRKERFECHEAQDGADGIRQLIERSFDLVLLDIDMPRLSGLQTLRLLHAEPPSDHLKIIMMSGRVAPDEMAELLALGADDYVSKPLSRRELVARVKAALILKATQDRSAQLNQQLLGLNAELEKTLLDMHSDLVHARNALVYTLAQIVESRAQGTTAHLTRMTHYVTALVRKARRSPRLALILDEAFLHTLVSCTLLHDIGNAAMPDHILRAPAALSPEDVMILQAHTTIGADTLRSVAKRDRHAAVFWQMAIDIARHHHEHFDGTGYPDRLAGNDIPLAARIVAVADAYDNFRRSAGLSHSAAVQMMTEGSRGYFDPLLLQAFQDAQGEFERICQSCPDTDGSWMPPLLSRSCRPSARTEPSESPGSCRSGWNPAFERSSRPKPTGFVG